MGWLTNDPEIAAALKLADANYETAKAMASGIVPLADKVRALREAKLACDAAYRAAFKI